MFKIMKLKAHNIYFDDNGIFSTITKYNATKIIINNDNIYILYLIGMLMP